MKKQKFIKQAPGGGSYLSEDNRFLLVMHSEFLRCQGRHDFWNGIRVQHCKGGEHRETWWQVHDLHTGHMSAFSNMASARTAVFLWDEHPPKLPGQYAVYTAYISRRTGRGIRHTFGPHTKPEAQALLRRFKREWRERQSDKYTFEGRVLKLIK